MASHEGFGSTFVRPVRLLVGDFPGREVCLWTLSAR